MELLTKPPSISTKKSKRVGRGYGSGRGGHTSGRGAKGYKARAKTKLTFDGTKIKKSWIKRTPFLRGKHRLLAKTAPATFNLSDINAWFKKGQTVSPKTLSKITKKPLKQVKILSSGKLDKALKFSHLSFSAAAIKKIIKAGGNINK